jgi:argininosuccinate lyase
MADAMAKADVAAPEAAPALRLWGGRFTGGPAPELDRLNRSLPTDRRLWREDVEGSRAWARALAAAGVLTPAEGETLRAGLARVGLRLGTWSEAEWDAAADEDVHTLVERLLYDEVGAVAGKLHTGRSRNDQVATDGRLWAMGAVSRLDALLRDVQRALLEQAEAHAATVIPAYTHLQRAQPVSAAHWLLSHAWPLARDRERLGEARDRVAVLPLGSGAIAGCAFPVDRVLLQETLGFRAVTPNSIDAVADRDWVAELLFVAAMVGVHLSRLAEDLIVYSTAEFGFVRMSDRFSTGSSLMPQKRNPDALELARGKAGRLIGELTTVLVVLKGLPSGYNKDLQEDKDAMFAAFDTLEALLPAVAGTVRTMEIDPARCAAAVDASMLATDLADFLVRKGVPFREAHGLVGRLVRLGEELGCGVGELPADVFGRVSPHFTDADLAALFSAEASLAARSQTGGTATEAVREQIGRLRAIL